MASTINSTNFTVNFNLGLCHYHFNELNDALKYFNNAKDINPDDHLTYVMLAEIYNIKNNFELALYNVNVSIKLNAVYDYAYFVKGLTYYGMKDYKNSYKFYTNAIQLNPTDAQYFCKRGLSYYMNGNYDQALVDFTKAIEIDNSCCEAFIGTAYTHQKLGNDSLYQVFFIKNSECLNEPK